MTYDINKAFLADKVYDPLAENQTVTNSNGDTWIVVAISPKSPTDYQGALFQKLNADGSGTGQYVFASRGTESIKDGVNDLQMGIGLLPDQMVVQRKFFSDMVAQLAEDQIPSSSIDLVGHSLGGALVQALAAENPQNKTTTFNAYGPGNLIAGSESKTYNNITNHVMALDGVSVAPGSKMLGTTLAYGPSIGLSTGTHMIVGNGTVLSGGPMQAVLMLSDLIATSIDGVRYHLMSNFLNPELAASAGTPVTIQPSEYGAQLTTAMQSVFRGLANSALSAEQFFSSLLTNLEHLFSSTGTGPALSGDPATGLPWPTDTFDALAADAAKAGAVAPIRNVDPLAFDLDGDGLETVGTTSSNRVLFDHNNDGVKTGTGWLKSDDAWLVLDRNGNGTIDSGCELFGVDTIKSNGKLATNGFDALRDLDINTDGQINALDAVFSNLKIWRDLNQDGVSQAQELSSLAEQNISAINLQVTNATKNLGNGNTQSASATFTRTNGDTTGTIANLDLVNDTFYSQFTNRVQLSEQAKRTSHLG